MMLISDAEVNDGAASLAVGVGSLSDPPERQGMAHFLEHMLFLGTEKYPEPDSEKKFLASHGGHSNAFTAEEMTNYYFQVSSDHLEEGLDRFAQFFTAPLFNPEYVAREMNAVHSEYSKNLANDFWRIREVEESLYEAGHPVKKLSIGTLETLKGTTREELLQFHKKYYSANLMTLAVLGKQDLDTLQKWVEDYFSAIPNHNVPPITFPATYLKKKNLLRVARIEPNKDRRTLKLSFALPSMRHLYESKPSSVLGHLIGHEGQGSLLSLLKNENLATGLSAGGSSDSSYGSFEITIQLTPRGLDRYKTVIIRVFQFLRLLRYSGYQEETFSEIQRMADINYRFQEKSQGSNLVTGFSSLLRYMPMPLVESAPYLYTKYDPHHFDSVLYRLTPDNMFVTLVAKGLKTDKVEPFFGAKYSYMEEDQAFIRKLKQVELHPELKLPVKNIFIPDRLSLLPVSTPFALTYQSILGLKQESIPEELLEVMRMHQGEYWNSWDQLLQKAFPTSFQKIEPFRNVVFKHAIALPEKILDDQRGEVWFRQDLRFGLPKAEINLLIHTPEVYQSARSSVLAQLYSSAVNEGLNEFGYSVHIAGLGFGISNSKKGISLSVSGYSDRILELTKILSSKLRKITIDDATFASLKEQRLRRYQNFQFNQPYHQALYIRSLLMEEKKFSIDQYQKEIKTVTLDELRSFAKTLYQRIYVQGVVHGNLEKDEAQQTIQTVLENLSGQVLAQSELFEEKIVQIKNNGSYIYRKKGSVNNSATVVGIQVGKSDPKLRGAMLIIANALRSQAYSELRTQQQLGYTVFADFSQMEETLGWMVLVQSGEYPAGVLQERIEAFLPKFIESFKNTSKSEFENYKQSVINAKLEKASSISGEADELFYSAFKKDADFDFVSNDIKAVESLTQNDVIEILEATLSPDRKPKLVIQVLGNSHQETPITGNIIENIPRFKDQQKQ
ncbi:MAG: insulinase family protein [SAR324 cluster bacterium]|nr:insulinase family protein [SAR324 cluster bacterium]